jgi:hypothetical protein
MVRSALRGERSPTAGLAATPVREKRGRGMAMTYNDLNLTCGGCGQTFVWTAYAQEWRASRGEAAPTRCKTCRLTTALERLATPASATAPHWDDLPLRTTTHKDVPGDPINLAFVGSHEALLEAFHAVGALDAQALSVRSDLRIATAALLRRSYPTAPVSNLFLFARPEDFAIEFEVGWVAQRFHARFWQTGWQDAATQRDLWLGAISTDIGIEVLHRHHLPTGTTHRIDPDLDTARDMFMLALTEADLVAAAGKRAGIGPTADGRNGSGDPFFTDGDVVVIVLK